MKPRNKHTILYTVDCAVYHDQFLDDNIGQLGLQYYILLGLYYWVYQKNTMMHYGIFMADEPSKLKVNNFKLQPYTCMDCSPSWICLKYTSGEWLVFVGWLPTQRNMFCFLAVRKKISIKWQLIKRCIIIFLYTYIQLTCTYLYTYKECMGYMYACMLYICILYILKCIHI